MHDSPKTLWVICVLENDTPGVCPDTDTHTHTGKPGRMGVGSRLDEGNVLDSPVNKNGPTRYFVTKHCERLDRWKREIRSRLSYCEHRAMLCRAPVSGIISLSAAELMSVFPKQLYHYFYDLTGKANQIRAAVTSYNGFVSHRKLIGRKTSTRAALSGIK